MTQSIHTNLEAALADLRGDSAALQLLASKFVKSYPEKARALSSAFLATDCHRLAAPLHRLRGALGIFHAAQAQSLVIAIEHQAQLQRALPSQEEFTCLLDKLAGVVQDLTAYLAQASANRAPD